MAQTSSAPAFKPEKTFTSYKKEQGQAYSQARRDYHPDLYQAVLDRHAATGGQFDTLIDIGCGPGNVARALAPHFTHVLGLDPSEGMLAAARPLGGTSASGEPIRFEVSKAEELGTNLTPPVQTGSVDVIAAGNAAHWFDMGPFWQRAAQVLRPGGSVALWTSGRTCIHSATPNADAIQAAFDEHETMLMPYFEPGNFLVRDRYEGLPLPWTLEQPVPEFEKGAFFSKDFDAGSFHVGEQWADLDLIEKLLATGSPQTRWNQAHPELVGTDRDCVKILRKNIEMLLHEAGVEKGQEKVFGSLMGRLIMVSKKA